MVALHLFWTVIVTYLLLGLAWSGIFLLSKKSAADTANMIYAIAGFIVLVIFEFLGSFGAAALTVRFATRQLGIARKNAPPALLPALFIILAVTGLPAAYWSWPWVSGHHTCRRALSLVHHPHLRHPLSLLAEMAGAMIVNP